jgi:hypothetical protein
MKSLHISAPSYLRLSTADRAALDRMLTGLSPDKSIGYQKGRRSSKYSLSREEDGARIWTIQRGQEQYTATVSRVNGYATTEPVTP